MKVLWIGQTVGPKTRESIIANGGKIMSAVVSQTNLLDGLGNIDIDSINAPKIDERLMHQTENEKWSRNSQSEDVCVGYKNIKYINVLTKEWAIVKATRAWAQKHNGEEVIVFVYGMTMPFIQGALAVKKYIRNAKICLIVPDLPQYMDYKMSALKRILKAIDWIRIKASMGMVDKYVLYAYPMVEFLQLNSEQWIVMEGSFDTVTLGIAEADTFPKAIMYSGVLDLRYGIPELLDAMRFLNDDYELWLTGDGNAVPLIKERAEADPRIKFYGFLPNRQDLLNKQATAMMLISPRSDVEEGSKYCFPSKLFEYMTSGNPVISCYLPGIPQEYHPYLIQLQNTTPESIAEAVQRVASMTKEQRDQFGQRAKSFILEKKNKYVQAQKMLDFAKQ